MTATQLDQLAHLARRIDVARLAVLGIRTDDKHEAVAEVLLDVRKELAALAGEAR